MRQPLLWQLPSGGNRMAIVYVLDNYLLDNTTCGPMDQVRYIHMGIYGCP